MPQGLFDSLWLPPQEKSWGITYKYEACDLIDEIEFHCGCSYYEKHGGFDGFPRTVEVGCDYQHLYDIESPRQSFHSILFDVQRAIDGLRVTVPDLKWRCGYNGKYYDIAEGQIDDNGEFLSNEGAQSREARQ